MNVGSELVDQCFLLSFFMGRSYEHLRIGGQFYKLESYLLGVEDDTCTKTTIRPARRPGLP